MMVRKVHWRMVLWGSFAGPACNCKSAIRPTLTMFPVDVTCRRCDRTIDFENAVLRLLPKGAVWPFP